jgi:fumarylpyruvate hydrolase
MPDTHVASYVIAPPPTPATPVKGGKLFPVRRVFCVGRNYAEHTREMGGDPNREKPFFFMKPADALVTGGKPAHYPPQTKDLHHEMELVVAIGKGGANISEADALNHVWGYAAGLDLTRRDLQGAAKKEGKPWDMGKGFDEGGPIGELVPASAIGHPTKGRIELAVNGKVRQSSDLSKMIWNIPETVAFLSGLVTIAPGDLIFTGTPEGVAACVVGDELVGTIEGVGEVRCKIV